MTLAVRSYERTGSLCDDLGVLNLSWTLDEQSCLAVDLRQLLASELTAEVHEGLSYLGSYFVTDPYGHGLLAPAVGAHFQVAHDGLRVTCGAGVNALLHALASVRRRATVCVLENCYPDFPHWAERAGSVCHTIEAGATVATIVDGLRHTNAAVFFLERPSFLGAVLESHQLLASVCAEAAKQGTLVIIDESNANYCPPSFSAIHLLQQHANLIVLRGLSKAYGLGGLRTGYAVSGPTVASEVEACVSPLQVASVSLRLAQRVLSLGDVTGELRAGIRRAKAEVRACFEALDIPHVAGASEHLPYVLLHDAGHERVLAASQRAIRGKRHPLRRAPDGKSAYIHRLSVPLSFARMARFRALMAGDSEAPRC